MTIKISHSQASIEEACRQIAQELSGSNLIIFFASSKYEASAIASQLQESVGDIPTIGLHD